MPVDGVLWTFKLILTQGTQITLYSMRYWNVAIASVSPNQIIINIFIDVGFVFTFVGVSDDSFAGKLTLNTWVTYLLFSVYCIYSSVSSKFVSNI